jgi:hypothetical protein
MLKKLFNLLVGTNKVSRKRKQVKKMMLEQEFNLAKRDEQFKVKVREKSLSKPVVAQDVNSYFTEPKVKLTENQVELYQFYLTHTKNPEKAYDLRKLLRVNSYGKEYNEDSYGYYSDGHAWL